MPRSHEGAKKKSLDTDFMDQGNHVAVIYADAVGSFQKTFALFATLR
jgi:hypothetical protein